MKVRPHAPNPSRGVHPPPFAINPGKSSAEIREMIASTIDKALSDPTGIAANPILQANIITVWAEMAVGKYLESIRERIAAGERVMRGTNMSVSAPWNWQSERLVYPADNDESFRLKIDQTKMMNYWGVFFLHQVTRNLVFLADGEVRRLYRVPRGVADHIKTLGSDQERDKFLAELTAHPEATMTFSVKTSSGEEVSGDLLFKFEALVIDPKTRTAEFHVLAAFTESSWERVQTLPPDDIALIVSGAIKDLQEQRKTLDEAYGASLQGETAPAQPQQPPTDPPMSAPPVLYSERIPTIGLPWGQSRVSVESQAATSMHGIRWPKRYTLIPHLNKLEQREVEFYISQYGTDKAIEDGLVQAIRKPGEPKPIGYRLTSGERTALRARAGEKGFIDRDGGGRERYYRTVTAKGRSVTVGVSWEGLAGPLFEEWVEKKKTDATREELDLFKRKAADEALDRLAAWEKSKRVMEFLRNEIGRVGTNPVEIPVDALRVLLWPERAADNQWPDNWKREVSAILTTLIHVDLEITDTDSSRKITGVTPFIKEWFWTSAGNGFYVIEVSNAFLAGIAVFESGRRRLKSGADAVSYTFTKPTKEAKAALGWGKGSGTKFNTTYSGITHLRAAEGLTSQQEALDKFIEQSLTVNRDPMNKAVKRQKMRPSDERYHYPRVYTSAFCPLLPDDKEFYGALDHYRKHPEEGRSLLGTSHLKSGRSAGLLEEMGYSVPEGRAATRRSAVVTQALEDIRKVVIEINSGVVAGKIRDKWFSFDTFSLLSHQDLKRLKVFMFVTTDYIDRRGERFEKMTKRRPTNSQHEADLDAWGEGETVESGIPLRSRFHIKMVERGLTASRVAEVFGVSKMMVSLWFKGTSEGGKRISDGFVPLIERWIETGKEPTKDEVSDARSRVGKRVGA